MNAAELFVRCLEREGVRYVFGLPGEENAHFMIALEDSPIEFVLCRHEQGAAFMADVFGRLLGEAGVCLGTLGPGATNLITGIADANMDRSPVVVITGQADSHRLHKESHQAMDVVGMFKPVTKWATPVIHPRNIPEIVRKAFRLARIEKPGATHIELAEDIAAMEADGEPMEPYRVRRPVPDDKIIDKAWDIIRNADNPIVIAGNGAIRRRASKQLRIFAEKTGIGVISTFMGKGAISRHAEQCLFTIGLQTRDLISSVIEDADVIVTLGYDLVEYHPRLWNPKRDKTIVHLDFQPAEIDEHYHASVEVIGDLAHALWMLNERAENIDSKRRMRRYAPIREQMLEDFAEFRNDDTVGVIKPQKVIWDTREVLGPDDILISDVGAHKLWVARYYHCDEPRTCLISNGFCSMGFALPGAIGAKFAMPDKNVVAICGDAGFLMNVQELETARRLNKNIVVMIWEDKGYGMISWKQQNQFGRHTNLSFENPDFVMLAEAFNCYGVRVERSRDLRPTLENALTADRPTIITIPIDYRENRKLTERLGRISCPI